MFAPSTIIGVLLACAVFAMAVMVNSSNTLIFVSISSLSLVLGATYAAALISYSTADILRSIRAIFSSLIIAPTSQRRLRELIKMFVDWNHTYRSKGIAALEKEVNEQKLTDPFIQHGLELLGSGYNGNDLRIMLSDDMDASWQRATMDSTVLNTLAVYSPSFGMVGTVIGLIIMLDNMNGDMAELGKGLALALITTLYGVVLANLIFRPCANQVTMKQEQLYLRRQLITEAFVLLSEKHDNLYLRDRLNAFLAPRARLQAEG